VVLPAAVAGFRHGVFYEACRCDCCRYGGRRLLDRRTLPFLDAARPPLPDDLTEDSAVVEKSARRLGLFKEGQLLRADRVADAPPGRDRRHRSPQSAQLLPSGARYRLCERRRMRSRDRLPHLASYFGDRLCRQTDFLEPLI
jgi:hypothetical protein